MDAECAAFVAAAVGVGTDGRDMPLPMLGPVSTKALFSDASVFFQFIAMGVPRF